MPTRASGAARALLCSVLALAAAPATDETARIRTLLAEAKFADAAELARTRLERVEAAHGSRSIETADALDLVVEALLGLGLASDDEVERLALRAVGLKESLLPATDERLATSLTLLGRLRLDRGDATAARDSLARAAKIRVAAAGPDDPGLIATYRNLGNALIALGELERAEDALGREGRLIALHRDELHMDAAANAYNRARLLVELGDYDGAERLYRRAAGIVVSNHGPDSPRMAWVGLGLGTVRGLMGDPASAIEAHEQALAVAEKTLPPDHPMIASCLSNLGVALLDLNDLLKAEATFSRALEVAERSYGVEHEATARTLIQLAEVARRRGRHDEAERHLARAETIFERTGSVYPRFEVRVKRAELLGDRGRTRDAVAEMEAAVAGVTKLLPDHPDLVTLNVRLAELLLAEGRNRQAQVVFRTALDLAAGSVGEDYPEYLSGLAGLATATARGGDPAAAFGMAQTAERLAVKKLRLMVSALPERQALEYAASRSTGLDLMLTLSAAGGDARSTARAWDGVIRARASVFDELALRRSALAAAGGAGGADEELVSASRRLANLLVRGPSGSDTGSYRQRLAAARERREAAEKRLARESRPYYRHLAERDRGFADVRDALPRDSALVAFVSYGHDRSAAGAGAPRGAPHPGARERRYAALVLSGDAEGPGFVPLAGAASIDDAVRRWRSALRAGAGDAAHVAREAEYAREATPLRKLVWDPVAPHVGKAARVFLVPDGALHVVSFGTLPSAGGRYLVETGPALHYLSAERDLVAQPAGAAGRGLLAVGGASYDDRSLFAALREQGEARAGGPRRASGRRGSGSDCPAFDEHRWGALSGTEREVRALARLWEASRAGLSGEPVRLLEGADASEARFKREAPGRRVVHLATHGFFLAEDCRSGAEEGTRGIGGLVPADAGERPPARAENPLALSGLVLAGANHRAAAGPDEEDGILTAEEVGALDLSGAEWVVLSACDTGLGEVRAGEGVLGLRRAFRLAGARTLIMSLWPVHDEHAVEWMEQLYRARLSEGADTVTAVTVATRRVLEQRRERGLSTHAAAWGGFVASGDWR